MTDKSMIYQVALEIYRRYDIKSFPFDIFSLVIRAGFDVHKYPSLKPASLRRSDCSAIPHAWSDPPSTTTTRRSRSGSASPSPTNSSTTSSRPPTRIWPTPSPPSSWRRPPLLSKEEKERLTPEQQKIIARIRRKRRKIAQELEDIEGQKNPIEEFGLLEAAMESWRLGEV